MTPRHTALQESIDAALSAYDAALERRIETARVNMCHAPTRERREAHMREMYRLIGQRSAAQVERMESEKGLS